MIALHRFNGQEFFVNADLIETVEATPDTVVSLTTGRKYIVKDKVEEIVRKAIEYKQLCNRAIQVLHKERPDDSDKEIIN